MLKPVLEYPILGYGLVAHVFHGLRVFNCSQNENPFKPLILSDKPVGQKCHKRIADESHSANNC